MGFASIAVTVKAQDTVLPLPDVPPAVAVEAPETTFVEEAEFATEESFAQAKALVADRGDGACSDLAEATIDEVKQSIEAEQATLNKIDTGAKCSSEGQTAIEAAKASLETAQQAKTSEDRRRPDAKGAKINFGDFAFDSLTPGNCDSMFSSSAYTTQKAAVDAATESASQAAGKVSQAQTAVSDAESAAKDAVRQCQCNAYKAHEAALEAANTKAEAANKAAWTKGYHLKCVLAGTDANSCTVPPLPKVQAVQLADGVSKDSCGPESGEPVCPDNEHKVSFPISTGYGSAQQTSTGSDKALSITGDCNSGFNFQINNPGWYGWYRGAFLPMKISQSDLPVTLSWTASRNGNPPSNNQNHAGYFFLGFDYVANNQQGA